MKQVSSIVSKVLMRLEDEIGTCEVIKININAIQARLIESRLDNETRRLLTSEEIDRFKESNKVTLLYYVNLKNCIYKIGSSFFIHNKGYFLKIL